MNEEKKEYVKPQYKAVSFDNSAIVATTSSSCVEYYGSDAGTQCSKNYMKDNN